MTHISPVSIPSSYPEYHLVFSHHITSVSSNLLWHISETYFHSLVLFLITLTLLKNASQVLDHWKNERDPEKHLFLYWLHQSLWLCGSQQTVENSKEIAIPEHLTWLLRNLYAGQEATVRTGHGTTDWFQIGKGVHQGCILSPVCLTYMQSTSWETLDWMKHKPESRLPGEI